MLPQQIRRLAARATAIRRGDLSVALDLGLQHPDVP
jgi:hypothetical protein